MNPTKARITELENRPVYVPLNQTNRTILGTPVRPNAEEQKIIEETLK